MRLSSKLLLASASVAAMAFPATSFAQQAPVAATTAAAVEEIVVIGTRRTDRTLADSASPVDVISASELKSQPTANLLDTLKNIIPSFYVGQNTISDASTFVRAPSLRGQSSDQVLVMLNGKRFNRSALVQVYSGGDTGLSYGSQGADISAIPSMAIKSLQVLRDGATAQYGSDAIAGVLNYGLKDNSSGIEIDARYGQYLKQGDGKSRQIAANMGFALGNAGFVNVTGEYVDEDETSRGATRPIALQFAAEHPELASQLPNYPGPAQTWGSSPNHGYKLMLNSGYDVTANSKIYFFANVASSKADQSFNYRSPISGTAINANGDVKNLNANGSFNNTFYLTHCPVDASGCPATGFVKDDNTFKFSSLYPAGFTPRFVGETKQALGTLGYKGKIASGLTYDLSGTFSENTLDLSMYNSLSASYGPDTQTSFHFGKLSQKETDLNLDLSYPLTVKGLAGPVVLSGGVEYRKETYGQTAGDEQSYGLGPYSVAQDLYVLAPSGGSGGGAGGAPFDPTVPTSDPTSTPPGAPTPGSYVFDSSTNAMSPGASGYGGTTPEASGSWSQTNYGVYGGAEADLTEKLSMGIAVRYEDYSTFGGTTVGKINGLYRVNDALSLRATVGTGFHAPSPGQSNDAILTTNFAGGIQVQTGTYPVDSPISKYFGAKTLKPETANNYGFGFVAKPTMNTVITVDAYNIAVKQRIGISQTFNVTADDVLAEPALIAVGVGGAVTYFTNGFNTRTQGVDVVATHRTELAGGRLNLTLAYNYNQSRVTRYDPAVISQDQLDNVKRLAPNTRLNLSGNWSRDNWSVNLRENYYGSWRVETDYPGQTFGKKLTTDLDVSYTTAEHYTVTVGATNLFNAYPDKIKQSSSNNVYPITGSTADGQIYPRNGGPFGMNGAFGYVRLRANF